MRHPVRRSLAVAAAAAGLLAFGATAAHADSDWQGTDKIGSQIFTAAEDGGRVVLPPVGDCDAGPGEVCRTYPELPSGYSVVKRASLPSGDEGEVIPRLPVEGGETPRFPTDPGEAHCFPSQSGREICLPVG